MEIGIMTQPFSGNYGGILQNWALQQVLRRMGHDPVTVEVVPSRSVSQEWKYLKMNTKALASRVTLQRPGRWFTWEKRRFTEAVAAPLRAFVDTQIRTCRVHASGLGALTGCLGAWIVGSDQVWRPAYNPDLSLPYLAFATDPSVRKIAYAASFGVDTWEYTPAQTAAARQAAARFDAVSVRERSGVGLCREHLGVAAEYVLDPTLLLDREAYLPLCDGDVHPGGTLLVYFLDPTPGKTARAASLAAARGLKMDAVLPFSLAGMQRREAGDFRLRPVGAWLRAFLEADAVVCDSFHGLLFSLLFEKDFWIVPHEGRGNARFVSVLEDFDLCDHILPADASLPEAGLPDWSAVRARLSVLRASSLAFLENNL